MSERSSSFVVWWRDHWQDVVPHSPALSDAENSAWLIWQAAIADRPEQPVARVEKDGYEISWLNQTPEPKGTLLYLAAPVARPEPAQPVAQVGMKLVPIEPTLEMLCAAAELRASDAEDNPDGQGAYHTMSDLWAAMLNAAPPSHRAPRPLWARGRDEQGSGVCQKS